MPISRPIVPPTPERPGVGDPRDFRTYLEQQATNEAAFRKMVERVVREAISDINALDVALTTLQFPVLADASRGSPGIAGRVIFNADDGNLNIDDGTNWVLPDGTVT